MCPRYGKRALLAGVYSSTELFMLTDTSPGHEETWQALDRRLSDMLALVDATASPHGGTSSMSSPPP